jgi:two-component system sensor histidine kinase YesM
MRTIRKKLFISYTNLIVGVIVAFAVLIFVYISQILSNQTRDMMTSLLTAGINQTDMEVRRMDTVSLNICYSEIVKGNFEKLMQKTSKIYASDERARAIIDALVAINGPLMPVQQINIYSLGGQVLSTGFSNKSIETNLASKHWYEPTLKLDGKKYITVLKDGKESYIYDTTERIKQYIVLDRVIFNKYGQQLAILEVISKSNQIFKSIYEIEDDYKGSIMAYVFDESGQMIYPVSNEESAALSYQTFSQNKEAGKDGYFKTKLGEDNYNVYYHQSSYTGWTLVLARSQKSIIAPVITLALFMMLITSIFIGVALLSSFIIAKDLSNPIKELLMTIKNTRLKNLDDVGDNKINTQLIELEELHTAFSNMRINIKESTVAMLEAQRQELKARMLALQSQMNPHFLYNTLTNISVMAEEGLNDGIVEMCDHVSFLLRYFSTSKPVLVKMSEEFECAKKYLSIVQIRYKDYLKYTIEMDEALQNIEIPRNIVQPLIENAVKYGMNEEMIWDIKIEGYFREDGWRIKISDKGNGFLKEKIQELQEKIDQINLFKRYIDLEINGMGFINVFSRLKLTYEENMYFEFGNDPRGGAVIIIGVQHYIKL